MKILLFNILFILSIQTSLYAQVNNENIQSDLTSFFGNPVCGNILRNYSIQFTFVNRDLDVSNTETIQFLDSLANYLIQYDSLIEIGTHISIKHSQHSSRNYNNMASDVLNYLVSRGVKQEKLTTKNYLDSSPILSLSDKTKFNTEKEFWEAEWNTNNRVEFKIITK